MNIFYLDKDPVIAASYHADKHVVKMILENAQMMSTVLHLKGYCSPYKPTHKHHPCTVWAMNEDNYAWIYELFVALLNEYTIRYGKVHKCAQYLVNFTPIGDSSKHTKPALAMPDEYKTDCPVESYRTYYINDKKYMAKYKMGNVPYWLDLTA